MPRTLPLRGKTHAAFLNFKGRARSSAFLRFDGRVRYVRPGARFRRTTGPAQTETARVLSVSPDRTGIPHVRYEVVIERSQRRMVDGPRLLSTQTFAKTYQESIGA